MEPRRYTTAVQLLGCVLSAALLFMLLPCKQARESGYNVTNTPTYLTCMQPPVHSSKVEGRPRQAADVYEQMFADQKLVQQYIQRCLKDAKIVHRQNDTRGNAGIAIVSGGVAMLSNTLAVVTILRESLHSALPVEVIYKGQDEYDQALVNQLQAIPNVTCHNAELTAYPGHHTPVALKALGYDFKAFVLAYVTSFDRVLLLDADNILLRNPDALFSGKEGHGDIFNQHGALFWPDWGQRHEDNSTLLADFLDVNPAAYTTFGLSVPWRGVTEPFRFTESGQLLFDRVRHADVLEWVWFLNSHQDPVYSWMYGDKDTFRLAFALAGKDSDFKLVPTSPRIALDATGVWHVLQDPPFRHTGMVQHDLAGNLQFLHRTYLGKFNPAAKEPWRQMNFVSNPLTEQQIVLYGQSYGFLEHQVSVDFDKHCCSRQDSQYSAEKKCSLAQCKLPGDPVPLLAIPMERLDYSVRTVLKQQDELFASITASHTAMVELL